MNRETWVKRLREYANQAAAWGSPDTAVKMTPAEAREVAELLASAGAAPVERPEPPKTEGNACQRAVELLMDLGYRYQAGGWWLAPPPSERPEPCAKCGHPRESHRDLGCIRCAATGDICGGFAFPALARPEPQGLAPQQEPVAPDKFAFALRQTLEYCAAETGKSHKGYFGPGGWAYETLSRYRAPVPQAAPLEVRELAKAMMPYRSSKFSEQDAEEAFVSIITRMLSQVGEVERLRTRLSQTANWLEDYAANLVEDGNRKDAERIRARADFCLRALAPSTTEVGEREPDSDEYRCPTCGQIAHL